MNLASDLEEALVRWSLNSSNISASVNDNASNIIAALDNLSWPIFGCFSHTLQLAVQKALCVPEMARAVGRAKRIVTHLRHSVKSTNVLLQRDLRYKEEKLIQLC